MISEMHSPIIGLPSDRKPLPAERALTQKMAEMPGQLLRDREFLNDFRDEWIEEILIN